MGYRRSILPIISITIVVCGIAAWSSCSQQNQDLDAVEAVAEPDGLRFEFILGGSNQEHYWKQMQAGAVAASNDYGVEVEFSVIGNPLLQRDAIERMVVERGSSQQNDRGVILALPDPSAVLLPLRSLVDAGVSVSIVDTDPQHFALVHESIVPIAYLGRSVRVSAEIIARWLQEVTAQRVLCIVHRSDNPALNLQCSEIERIVADEIELITTPLGNTSSVEEYETAIASRLENIPDIDFIITLNAEVAELASRIVASMGLFDVRIGTLGVDETVGTLLQDRQIVFAVSQQPFLQGYLSVAYLYLHKQYGIAPTEIPQLTGPQIFDSGTVTLLSPFMQNGTR